MCLICKAYEHRLTVFREHYQLVVRSDVCSATGTVKAS